MMCEEEFDYNVTKFTDQQLETKLELISNELDFHQDNVSKLTEELNYLYDEKNKRYHESQNSPSVMTKQ